MKLWGGRFTKSADAAANSFQSSLSFDQRLYKHDINGSIAHADMLGKQGIIAYDDANAIVKGLNSILADIEAGQIEFDIDMEDIHMNIEKLLTDRIGEAGKRLHTGRSRNDQVALDMRMYVKEEITNIQSLITALLNTLTDTAKKHTKTIMPGYTHLQKAQPITLAHHCLAYAEMFKRDFSRLEDCYKRTDEMPLGSGALAATNYDIDRYYVAEKLNFSKITANSLDAVSDRDFCLELLSCLSIIMVHLSRFCEEIILWATNEFSFIELDDAFSTGSSIMPQKKNPDYAELIRGKTGRVFGNLTALLTVMKGLPLSYNKDMQEDKESVFDSIDTVKACLSIFTEMYKTLTFKTDNMLRGAKGGYINATGAADYLVKKGVSFRKAHEITGNLVLFAISKNLPLESLSLNDFQQFSSLFSSDIYQKISPQACVNLASVPGGPSEAAVLKALKP